MKTLLYFACLALCVPALHAQTGHPNIVLVMTDDQGWGEVGYYDHPYLKTPNLDAMAANGLRFDRFYAGAPNCSPTRATVMTGRTHDRTGVENHGYPLHLEEKTVAQALKAAGYATGHFGKWHLDGLRGPGAPILADDPRNPGAFGFDTWVSVTNFFDINPLMSRQGEIEAFEGDSSEIAVTEALKFINTQVEEKTPFFTVVWFGSPHSPMVASEADRAPFKELSLEHQNHLGEIVALDRAVGMLRSGLRDAGVAENTLVWYNSDNGGLKGYGDETVGGLRGWKNTINEGGLRVPCVIEWPAVIKPRITMYPAGTVDIFPTLADIVGLPESAMIQPLDGLSLKPLFTGDLETRSKPLTFRHQNRGVLLDGNARYKLLCNDLTEGKFELYDLKADPHEDADVAGKHPEVFDQMLAAFKEWNQGVDASVAGKDYPGGKMEPAPEPRFWKDVDSYQPYLEAWKQRPEYEKFLKSPSKKLR